MHDMPVLNLSSILSQKSFHTTPLIMQVGAGSLVPTTLLICFEKHDPNDFAYVTTKLGNLY